MCCIWQNSAIKSNSTCTTHIWLTAKMKVLLLRHKTMRNTCRYSSSDWMVHPLHLLAKGLVSGPEVIQNFKKFVWFLLITVNTRWSTLDRDNVQQAEMTDGVTLCGIIQLPKGKKIQSGMSCGYEGDETFHFPRQIVYVGHRTGHKKSSCNSTGPLPPQWIAGMMNKVGGGLQLGHVLQELWLLLGSRTRSLVHPFKIHLNVILSLVAGLQNAHFLRGFCTKILMYALSTSC